MLITNCTNALGKRSYVCVSLINGGKELEFWTFLCTKWMKSPETCWVNHIENLSWSKSDPVSSENLSDSC